MISVARLLACLLVVALAGPSVATLACEWLCAAHHQQSATTEASGCHGHHPDGDSPKLAAGDVCHDLLSGDVMLRPATVQVDSDLAILAPAVLSPFETFPPTTFAEGAHHSPPAPVRITPPLRI